MEVILAKFDQGIKNEYDMFLSRLKRHKELINEIPNPELAAYLKSLSKCAIKLNRSHKELVNLLLASDWITRDETVLDELHHFICELISARTSHYLLEVLKMIVCSFKPKVSDPNSELIHTHNESFSRLHRTLLSVLTMVPNAGILKLADVLRICYPNIHVVGSYGQECFVKNMLKLAEYPPKLVPPKLRGCIFQLIVKHMIDLDVRVAREDLQRAEELDANEAELPFAAENPAAIPKEAQVLDRLMMLMFVYIRSKCFIKDGNLDKDTATRVYHELRSAFDVLLLPTHESCHVQFLLFYLCSFGKAFADDFLQYLWQKVENLGTESLYKQIAVLYIGSFLARAKYVSVNTVRSCLKTMAEWIHCYIVHSSDMGVEPDPRHHRPFYAVCRALFYVFIFRSKELLSTERGRLFCKKLNLQRIVSSDLNPLRFCLQTIALTFSTIVRNNYLAVCDTILEKNRRCFIPEVNAAGVTGSEINLLDSFFPFDPYLLKDSSGFIADIYQEYECPEVTDNLERDSHAFEEAHYMELADDDYDMENSNIDAFLNLML